MLLKRIALVLGFLVIGIMGGSVLAVWLQQPASQATSRASHSPAALAAPGVPVAQAKAATADFKTVWFTDYGNSEVKAVDRSGAVTWEEQFPFPSVPDSGQPSNVEFMSLASNGDLMVTTANGMLVEEIDRVSHKVVWHYGILNQQYCDKCLHQPKKAYLLDDHEVLVTDANNRRVIIIDKNTNKITWQYGHTAQMSDKPGFLKGPRFAMPINNNQQILLSDTLTKKIMIIDRASQNIVWQWAKPDSQWLQNVFPTSEGTFVAEDHLHDEVWEVNRAGQILWDLHLLADGQTLKYPTDAVKLQNGNVLIAEGGRQRIIEVNPQTKQIVWQYDHAGLATSMAVEY